MKNILFTFLFAACAAMGLSSCMNGDYDANPLNANSSTNPLLTTGGSGNGGSGTNIGVAAKGEIRCLVNGSPLIIKGANWQDLIGRIVGGSIMEGTTERAISFIIIGYTGSAGTFPVDEPSGNNATYKFTDYLAGPSIKTYRSSADGAGGSGEVIVTSDANDEMKGTFNFVAYTTAGGEKATITNGSFFVTKL